MMGLDKTFNGVLAVKEELKGLNDNCHTISRQYVSMMNKSFRITSMRHIQNSHIRSMNNNNYNITTPEDIICF